MTLDNICLRILNECVGLKKHERCLIVTDKKLKSIGTAIYKNSLKITKQSKLILTKIPAVHGAEPSSSVAHEMLKHDVILIPTTKSLTHTRARQNASRKGARIATMPGITIDMMIRALNVDFYSLRALNNKLISNLRNKNMVRITTKKGTDIWLFLKGRKWKGDDGICTKECVSCNLPAGEIFIAPLEGKANGTIVVDASIGGLGKVDKDVVINVKDGFIVDVEGGKIANKFKKLLKNKLYKNVAELGIGTNPKAKITGNVLEDEKVAGTCHIAFGNNKHFGGKVDVPFHVDVVVKSPTIHADDVFLMDNGKINA